MIIKCPECGRQVSEKAPVCPSCGVQIAGKLTRCNNCGEVYFTEDRICPVCHMSNGSAGPASNNYQPQRPEPVVAQEPKVSVPKQTEPNKTEPAQPTDAKKEGNKNHTPAVIAIIFSLILFGALFYFYSQNQSAKEEEEYEFAMRSEDPEVLQSYLLRFTDAPTAHRDSIQAHLLLIQKGDEEWRNAVLSNSRTALQQYLDRNPESVHRQEALNRIDSLDWLNASKAEDQELLEAYVKEHSNGRYIDEAQELLSKVKRANVQPEEKQMIAGLFRKFFQSINSRNESQLVETVGMVLDTFLGKQNATSDDVVTFMNKIYKDVNNMNWRIDSESYKMQKTEVAENEYEYSVTFNARKEVERNGETISETYKVRGSVSTDGRISGLSLTKVN